MKHAPEQKEQATIKPLGPRIVWTIVRVSGLLPITIGFIAGFLLVSLLIAAVEPGIPTFGDAAWFLFTVIITIGLGDFTCVTLVGRLASAVLSLYSVFYLALITGTVVNYCGERLKAQRNESIAAFIDQLERLPELSHDELVALSEHIKRMR